MFRTLARLVSDPTTLNPAVTPSADAVLALHPLQLSRWLEEVWGKGGVQAWPVVTGAKLATPLGATGVDNRLQVAPELLADGLRSGLAPGTAPADPSFRPAPAIGMDLAPLPWDHLIYAYLVESTGIVEVLTEVVRRYVTGETIDPPSMDTLVWARTTEELFLRDSPQFHVTGVTSSVRPDAAVNRRNAYWRMFGADLPHALDARDPQVWKRGAGAGVNSRFLEIWNELLRQVWMGIENDKNAVGANPTDPSYVAYLCQTLGEMLRLRRRGGMLAREEFSFVAMMSWFHLTVESDTAPVRDLRATAGGGGLGNPADRLMLIASRVGLNPPREARELFELADLLSPTLWFIELGHFDASANASLLFKSFGVQNAPIPALMTRIVDLWQSATGVRVKDASMVNRTPGRIPGPAQPAQLPSAMGRTAPRDAHALNGNGAPVGQR
jgi:hypothetical protein